MTQKVSFKIRHSTIGDIPALEALIPLSARALQIGFYSPEQIEGAIGTVFGVDTQLIRDRTYYVVEANNCIVGCGGWSRRQTRFGGDSLRTSEDDLLNPQIDAARIRAFFVHPDWARRGIGRCIMETAEAAAIAAGFVRIEIVATLAGAPLYRAFGYQTVEFYEIALPNGARMPVVRLAKNHRVI